MKESLFLFGICLLVLAAIALNCGDNRNPLSTSESPRLGSPQENPLAGRTNPLQTFIRDHWTGGDQNKTGGLHYSHIKIYGHNYRNFEYFVSDPDDQAAFVAHHFDMYMWGGPIVGTVVDPDDFLWLEEAACVPRACPTAINNWISQPGNNPSGWTLDDHLLHYMWNTFNWIANDTIPGYNWYDDYDGSGCIDSTEGCDGLPCQRDQSAQCILDARVNWYAGGSCDYVWASLKQPYYDYIVSRAVFRYGLNHVKGYHFDCVAYQNPSLGLGYTHEYNGYDEAAQDFPMIDDLYAFVPWAVYGIEGEVGQLDVNIANCVLPGYTCANSYQKAAALEYLENVFNECWMFTNDPNNNKNFRSDRIEDWLDCPFADYMEQGKGYVFTCYDEAYGEAGSDRGREFSLATFYMINHQMAFYYYRTKDHMLADPDKVWICQWNPMVEFDVGQPNENALGLPDFQGNYNTDLYFVWAQQANRYKILGREYLREDGRRVLVLTKIRDPYNSLGEGLDPTTHTLPHLWYRLNPDMTWGPASAQITLTNNEGAILLKYIKGGGEPPIPREQ